MSLERNLRELAGLCRRAGVALRPHGKMHKSSGIARLQIAEGAVGLCCQTVDEAEAFAAAGIDNLLLTAPVPAWGAAPLAALAAHRRVAAVVDSPGQVEHLAAAASAAGATLGVLVDVNLGQHRSGVAPEEAPALVAALRAHPALRWEGLQCYLGHLQHDPERERPHAVATARLATLVADLRAAGMPPRIVTGGGTGTAALDCASGVFTELQAGSYAFMDVQYAEAGAPFAPALFLATSVVSARHKTHVTVDAGFKALAADGPPARVVAGAPPGSLFRFQGDEHGAILHPAALARAGASRARASWHETVMLIDRDPAFPWPADAPAEGALVWLQPGHVDPTVNLHAGFHLADETGSLGWMPIDARREPAHAPHAR